MPSVGNCCTLTGLRFVFITLHNDFFNNTPLKNSVYYIFVFYTWNKLRVCTSADVENIFWIWKEAKIKEIKKNERKKEKKTRKRGIISKEGLTAFLFWSLLHNQPGCDYSQIVLSDNRSQMQLIFFFLLSSFSSLKFFFLSFFGEEAEREMVCTWYCCVGTPVWDLIREPLERRLFKSVHVHSE